MRVIENGTGQTGWATEALCTGRGNGNGGCGALLMVDQPDLFRTRHFDETYVTFKCRECGVLTDLGPHAEPGGSVRRSLPFYEDWLKVPREKG